MPKPRSVNRAYFIQQFVAAGFGYVEACRAYEAMIATVRDAVISGSKIYLGPVGSIKPVRLEPKVVHMGFKREGKSLKKMKREFILGWRIRYKFCLNRSFIRNNDLNWFGPE